MTDPPESSLPVGSWPPPIAVVVLNAVAYVVLIAGWIVTGSWGWAAVSAIVLASVLVHQGLAFQRRRADRPRLDLPWRWPGTVTIIVGDLVVPIVAVLSWDPPWHGFTGALLLTMNAGLLLLSMVQALQWPRRERG